MKANKVTPCDSSFSFLSPCRKSRVVVPAAACRRLHTKVSLTADHVTNQILLRLLLETYHIPAIVSSGHLLLFEVLHNELCMGPLPVQTIHVDPRR